MPSFKRGYLSAASRGLVLAMAQRFALDGADLVLSSRYPDHLQQAADAVREVAPSASVRTVAGDLATIEGQDHIIAWMRDAEFSPDIFVCSAGQPPDVRLGSLTREQWTHDVEMILSQAVFAAKEFIPSMAERGYGRFIFISSTYATDPNQSFITSSIPRAGLYALSQIITKEYANAGIASFVINLGFVDTPLLRNMALGRNMEDRTPVNPEDPHLRSVYSNWAEAIPARRIGTPEELAELAYFLTTPVAHYLSGTVFFYSGGLGQSLL